MTMYSHDKGLFTYSETLNCYAVNLDLIYDAINCKVNLNNRTLSYSQTHDLDYALAKWYRHNFNNILFMSEESY